MAVSRPKKAGNFPGEHAVNTLAHLRDEPPKAVIGQRLRIMSPRARRDLALSERQTKALCNAEHNPQLEKACALAKADPVIRAKIILDCLPDEMAVRLEHLRWDSLDDQIEFHKAILLAVAGALA